MCIDLNHFVDIQGRAFAEIHETEQQLDSVTDISCERALFACVLFANRINILEIFLVSFMQSAESQDGTTRADFLQRQIRKVEVGARTL